MIMKILIILMISLTIIIFPSNYHDLKHNIVPTKQYKYLHNHSITLQDHQIYTSYPLGLLGQENQF